jgi:hypothetical protein
MTPSPTADPKATPSMMTPKERIVAAAIMASELKGILSFPRWTN